MNVTTYSLNKIKAPRSYSRRFLITIQPHIIETVCMFLFWLPVAWSNMMSKDGKYTISPEYFDRIDEIVGYILDNDMYCIINIHWDGGWWEDFGSSDEKVAQAAMDKYTAMWKQIAKHYKSYSDKLIFESANEELGSKTKGSSSMNESYERVNSINQKEAQAARTSPDSCSSQATIPTFPRPPTTGSKCPTTPQRIVCWYRYITIRPPHSALPTRRATHGATAAAGAPRTTTIQCAGILKK